MTHDQLRADPEEQTALMIHGVKTFVLMGRAPHRALGELFVRKIKRIKRLIEAHDGPFLAKLYIETGEVKVTMSLEDWLARQGRRWRR